MPEPIPAALAALVVADYAAGASARSIGRTYGVSHSTVLRLAAAAGIRPAPNRSRADTAPCGTYAAYSRHEMHGEIPCDACRLARQEYRRRKRAERVARERAAATAADEGADA